MSSKNTFHLEESNQNKFLEDTGKKKEFTLQTMQEKVSLSSPSVLDHFASDYKYDDKDHESSIVSDTTMSSLINNFGNNMYSLVQQMMKEKISLHTQNMQLWKIIDKQRAMIFELQKDLEKAFKEKKKYHNLWSILSAKYASKNEKETEASTETHPKNSSLTSLVSSITESQKGSDISKESRLPDTEKSKFTYLFQDNKENPASNTSNDFLSSTLQSCTFNESTTLPHIPEKKDYHLKAVQGKSNSKQSLEISSLKPTVQKTNLYHDQLNVTESSSDMIQSEEIPIHKEFNIERNLNDYFQDMNINKNLKDFQTNKLYSIKQDEINQTLENKDNEENNCIETSISNCPDPHKMISSYTKSIAISSNVSQNNILSSEHELQNLSIKEPDNLNHDIYNKYNKKSFPKNLETITSQENTLSKQDDPKVFESDLNLASICLPSKANFNAHEDYIDRISEVFDDMPSNEENIEDSFHYSPGSNFYLSNYQISSISLRILNSKLRMGKNKEEIFFSIGVFQNVDKKKELWRVEKNVQKILDFDDKLRRTIPFWKIPDITCLDTQNTTRIDQRKALLEQYLRHILSIPLEESSYSLLNDFLNTDVETQTEPQILYNKQNTIDEKYYNEHDSKPCNLIRKEGYLTKRGRNFGGWKSRYFVLDGPILKYYESQDGVELGTIRLSQAQIGRQQLQTHSNSLSFESHPDVSCDENSYRHAFLILEPKRSYSSSFTRHVLCAKSDKDCDEWVEALMQYVNTRASDNYNRSINVEKRERKHFFRKHSIMADGSHPISAISNIDTYHFLNNESRITPENSEINVGKQPELNFNEHRSSLSPIDNMGKNTSIDFTTNPALNELHNNSKFTQITTNSYIKSYDNNCGNYVSEESSKLDKKFKKKGFWAFVNRDIKQRPFESVSHEFPKSSSNVDLNIRSSNYGIRNIFGVPLSEAVYISRLSLDIDIMIPSVVYRCIEYLDNNNAEKEEGIYRLSGSNAIIRSLKDKFNIEGDVNLLNSGKSYDIHAIAGLLKLYLRELPTNVLTRELHSQFLLVMDIQNNEEKADALSKLVHHLPDENFCLLRVLISHLYRIVAHSDLNKMTSHNVGIVFSPTLNIPAGIFSMFLVHYDTIFEDQPTSSTAEPSLD